jgi:acyl-CoA thioesterase-1
MRTATLSLLLLLGITACRGDAPSRAAPPRPSQSTPSQGTPSQGTPSQGTPAQGVPAQSTPTAQQAAPALVFLGDSLTAGHGLAASESLPARIEARLTREGLKYRVINAGRSGDTSAGGLARLPWYLRKDQRVAAIVIGLGSNDAMRGLPLAELENNLRRMVRTIRAFDPGIQVLLFQMHTFPNMGREYADAYSELFPRVARSEGIPLLPFPLEGVAGVPALNQADGIHPTAEGTQRMADNVWRALAPHLNAAERHQR